VAGFKSESVADFKSEWLADFRRNQHSILEQLGDDVSGFALVVWDRRGELRSSYNTGHGPLRPALVPTLAGDALNRHVALDMAPPTDELTRS